MSPMTGFILLLTVSHAITTTTEKDKTEEKLDNLVKPGECPANVDYSICNGNSTSECETDKGCKGAMKCCIAGCKKRCLLPLQAKMDSCPYFNHTICIMARPIPSECHNDDQCQGTERCCCNNCRLMCTPTVKVKPGQCPAPKKDCPKIIPKEHYSKDGHCPKIIPKALCSNDGNCTGTKKCCDQCGMKCVTPEQEHAGVCPISLEKLSCIHLSKTLCNRDSDCPMDQKCCLSENIMQCQPVKEEKPGDCPPPRTRCKKFDEPLCTSDIPCPGNKKCCIRDCRKECIDV